MNSKLSFIELCERHFCFKKLNRMQIELFSTFASYELIVWNVIFQIINRDFQKAHFTVLANSKHVICRSENTTHVTVAYSHLEK